jgi:dTDP-4-dehydrorhamnose 3,5-epimerase
MRVREVDIEGIKIIEPGIFEDKRGYFFESYNEQKFKDAGINMNFVQDNQSRSSYGVVRGLHMQTGEFRQTKLVRVLEGKIFDVAVDLRSGSPTYGRWFGAELSAQNKVQMLIPKGFCHGFSVRSEFATVFYKCDELYHPEAEAGVRFNDTDLGIDWKLPLTDIIVSEKDAKLPFLKELNK